MRARFVWYLGMEAERGMFGVVMQMEETPRSRPRETRGDGRRVRVFSIRVQGDHVVWVRRRTPDRTAASHGYAWFSKALLETHRSSDVVVGRQKSACVTSETGIAMICVSTSSRREEMITGWRIILVGLVSGAEHGLAMYTNKRSWSSLPCGG